MHYFEVLVLSGILMLAILFDVLQFPLLRKIRGSRFFSELTVAYSVYLVISIFEYLGIHGILTYPLWVERILWTLHFLSFPSLLALWMHFTAINVIGNERFVKILTLIHVTPLVVLAVLAFLDIPKQVFYPFSPTYEHLPPAPGAWCMVIISLFFCLVMLLVTLGHRKELQGSLLFLSLLTPIIFIVSVASYFATHSHALFVMVNPFMMVLHYLVGQGDSVNVDTLTELPTYSLLERKMIRIYRFSLPHTVILFDIENFRYFDSHFGNPLGDALLVDFSSYLRTLGGVNEVFHIAKDQFCLCIPAKHGSTAETLVKAIKGRLEQPWKLEDQSVYIQVNLAVIEIPKQASTLDEFKRASDQLLLEIKTVRKKSVLLYNHESVLTRQRDQDIVTALRDSIRKPDQVVVHYQPIIDLRTNQMVAAEALMRINDEVLGFLPPDQFIHLAEQSGLIMPLTQILLGKVCKMARLFSDPTNTLEYISVNLSGEDFSSKTIGKTLLDIIEREGIKPEKIGFEITESVVLQSYETVAEVMRDLSLKNVFFALDDFGTGYSNLRALMDLPHKYVKFDKSVIQGAVANPKMLTLLAELLHKMDKCLVAEGVETEEELSLVKGIGIDRVQGYYFSKPLEEEAFLEFAGIHL